jgi:hypothetical protein
MIIEYDAMLWDFQVLQSVLLDMYKAEATPTNKLQQISDRHWQGTPVLPPVISKLPYLHIHASSLMLSSPSDHQKHDDGDDIGEQQEDACPVVHSLRQPAVKALAVSALRDGHTHSERSRLPQHCSCSRGESPVRHARVDYKRGVTASGCTGHTN